MRATAASHVTRRELAACAAGFCLLTAGMTYPQLVQLSSHIPAHHDALFTTWRLAWIAHQLPRNPSDLFDANIFYPAEGTLAYSDALLLPGLVAAPFIWAGASPVSVLNVLTLLSFVALGVGMYVLARALTASKAAGWIAGVIVAFQSYRYAHFAHLELLWACWIPLAFWALHRALETRRVRDGALVGSFVALQALSSLYYAIFLITALGVLLLALLIGRRRAELGGLIGPAVAAAALCVLIIGPYAMPYLESRRTVGPRTRHEIVQWSPTLRNYAATPPENWLYRSVTGHFGHQEATLFPGVIASVLAAAGLAGGGRRRLAYGVLLLVAFDMSLGFNGLTYRALYDLLWPYQGLRVPARMFVIVSVALGVLAAFGVAWLGSRWRRASRAAAAVLTAGILLESAAIPVPLWTVPAVPTLYAWLAQQPPAVVLEWPMPRMKTLGSESDPVPLYMYYSTFHWQRLVNGYSGFYPSGYISFIEGMRNFPDEESIGYVTRRGVRYVILHRSFAPERYPAVRGALLVHPDFALVTTAGRGDDEITVFEVRSAQGG